MFQLPLETRSSVALVALAQPAASATRAVIAASVVAIHRGSVMRMRRIPASEGSVRICCELDELELLEWRAD